MDRFDPEVNPALSHIMLYEQAVGSGPIPQAYLCCAHRQNQTKIFCLHLPSRYTGALDGHATPWDSLGFACLGEVTAGQVTTVMLPDNCFRAAPILRAKTADYIVTHLEELEAHGLPAALVDDLEAPQVRTRAMMYLPAKYAALLLNPTGYSLRQVWEILYTAIVDNNDLAACGALIKWLRCATMGSTVVNNANAVGPSSLAIELEVPLADADLINHRMRLQRLALPGLYQAPETLERAITQMAAAVTLNTNENRTAREQKATRQQEPKLPSDRFTVTLGILQGFLEVEDEANLPPLWHQWANSTKKQDFNVFTELLQAYSRGPEAFSSCAPIASAKLVQDLLNFTFVSESTDDIKTGLQPFVIVDGSAEHRQANLEIARTYGLLQSGDQALLLSDLHALQAKEVFSVPVSYFELERNLGMFGNLVGTVLGSNHIITTTYRAFWNLLARSYRNELQQIIDTKRYIKPAHLLRSIQLICYNWFAQRRAQLNPPPPDFTSILYNVTLNTYVLPNLPPALYKLAYPKPAPLSMPTLIDLSSQSSASGTSSSGNSTISSISTPPQRRNTHVVNLAPDASLVNLIPPGMQIKDIIAQDPPPLLDDGSQVCLAFLLRQGCWSSCRRAAAHTHTLTPTEHARLTTYLTNQARRLRSTATNTVVSSAHPRTVQSQQAPIGTTQNP